MTPIPRTALILGLAGVLPFAATALAPFLGLEEPSGLGWSFHLLIYGLMILAFMSGCIWAFAARADDALGYGLSTVPALFGAGLLMLGIPFGIVTDRETAAMLAIGFVALLGLDLRAARLGQTPEWWIRLRVLLTSLVVACLLIGAVS